MFCHKSNLVEYYLKDTFDVNSVTVKPLDDITAKVIFKADGSSLLIKEADYNLIEIYIDDKLYQTLKLKYVKDTLKRYWVIFNG